MHLRWSPGCNHWFRLLSSGDEWCAKVGRDPLEIERSAGVSAKNPAQSAEALYAVGTRLFTVGLEGPAYALGPWRDRVDWRDGRKLA